MAKFSQKKIKEFFTESDAATSKAEKGECLENLTCYLFKLVPGISHAARNQKNTYDTEEIDVALWNDQHARGFKTT